MDSVDEDTEASDVFSVELVRIDICVSDVWLVRVLDSELESSEEDSASVVWDTGLVLDSVDEGSVSTGVWDRELVVESVGKDMEVCDVCSGLGLVYVVLE